MKRPNFFVVGAAKTGTTSLYYYLKQHYDIYMAPIKEPHFFAKDIDINSFRKDYRKRVVINIEHYLSKSTLEEISVAFIRNIDDYLQLFKNVRNEKAIGEISNSYLYSTVAAKEIYEFNPDARIIIIIRDPVERAYSHYIMNLRDGLTKEKDFVKEVINDYNQPRKGWGISHLYVELGLYYEQIKRYLEVFPRENVKIILYDDFKKNVEKTVREIFDFLNVDTNVDIDFSKRVNVGAVPKNVELNKIILSTGSFLKPLLPSHARKFIKNIYRKLLMKSEKPKLTLEQKESLLPFFLEDIERTQELIGRDLSMWIMNKCT